jgi:hypothetical protein
METLAERRAIQGWAQVWRAQRLNEYFRREAMSEELTWVCDCPTKDALVCKEHPDCRPSYCKMRLFDPPIVFRESTPETGEEHGS